MSGPVISDYYSASIKTHRRAVKNLHKKQQNKLGKPTVLKFPKVSVNIDSKIPKLAWLCQIVGPWYGFTVGSGVEVFDNFIFEGVWDGIFEEKDIDKDDYVYGSGALVKECVVFIPPKHCRDYLYVLSDKKKSVTYVSNSMNFLFNQINLQNHNNLINELKKSLKVKNIEATSVGFDLYDQLVFETGRFRFFRMIFYNFTVNNKGQFKVFPSFPKLLFRGFKEYKTFLLEKMNNVISNGMDLKRKIVLTPLTPISSGYDSPCVATLASNLGYLDAVTIKVFVKGKRDSGEIIGKKLGMKVEVVEHFLGKILPKLATTFPEDRIEEIAEFIATPGNGDDVMLKSFEKLLNNRIILIGAYGDSVWKRASKLRPGLPSEIIYGNSFSEFRLRIGFAYVPVPAIGARFVWPIKKMTNEPEMKPFTLNQPYDRPFPRRIIEEAGIPRGGFAVSKAAMNPTIINSDELFEPSLKLIMARYESARITGMQLLYKKLYTYFVKFTRIHKKCYKIIRSIRF